ncbi:uncharacterized protein Z518_01882 [Rhinocladiella mackenziei CBS 650.93]|uniref:Rhinocladiella mackenziei CBS 650.93 unplaced genomic scaffold supercont1.2, whole genome shotgun sequence n=1 Tax=Rhinocladiella mackenziei CBS 650.93 TaxID=1442369 RepID=A0A0D2IN26_9EURO|nr:uncharacterized protein Z518_01882 [Rhinocladiella mackenziei CBS 650.93]KIX07229.1 hypothetical protein Z518_01882 [Rhinocladiella mackenziei CBS 650.93]
MASQTNYQAVAAGSASPSPSPSVNGDANDGNSPVPDNVNEPTPLGRVLAINTLRDRINPGIVDGSLLEIYLRSTTWDVDMAYARWTADRNRILADTAMFENDEDESIAELSEDKPMAGGDEEEELDQGEEDREDEDETFRAMRDAGLLFNANWEQERRDAALALRIAVQERSLYTQTLSPSQAVLVLHLAQWDLGDATARYVRLRRRLAGTFDHMRTRLQQELGGKSNPQIMMEQDERLAEFITITGRPDWYSLRVCLQEHDWDLVQAVSHWFLNGVRIVTPPANERLTDRGIRVDHNLNPLDLNEEWQAPEVDLDGWDDEPETFELLDSEDSSPGSDLVLIKKDGKRQAGFLVNNDRDTAKVGLRNESKFLVEYVSKGKLHHNRFQQANTFMWPELRGSLAAKRKKSKKALVEFNWNRQDDVNLLNNWRRQAMTRATGLFHRARSQPWSREESDFLYQLSEELLEELKLRHPELTENDLLPLTVSAAKKKEWADRMNAKFTGTMQEGSRVPRADRKPGAVMTARARCQAIVDRFKVKPDKQWFDKQEKKNVKAGTRRKHSEMETEEPEDNEDVDAEEMEDEAGDD